MKLEQALHRFTVIKILTAVYIAATIATLAFLWRERDDRMIATDHAWGHAVTVLVLAVVMVAVVRKAAHGSRRALLRLRIMSVLLPVFSVALALLPGFLPFWMRVEQGMYGALFLVIAAALAGAPRAESAAAMPDVRDL